MTLVKICGLRTQEHAVAAAKAGADMLGFVFAPSKRRVAPEQAVKIITTVRAQGYTAQMVGLFVNETAEHIAAISEQCGLDVIQLSGDEPISLLEALPERPVLKAVRLAGSSNEHGWLASRLERVTLLVDAHVAGSYGGTGAMANWDLAMLLARQRPILLAGGLDPVNVGMAIARVQPLGVDVSSGVERDGQKDSELIRSFVVAARGAVGESMAR